MRSLVASLVLAAAAADRSGPVSYFEEMTAAGKFLYDAGVRYGENGLITAVLSQDPTEGADEDQADLTNREDRDGDGNVDLGELKANIADLERFVRRDEEGMEFRGFLVELAEQIVRAGRLAPFGARVSDAEREFVAELRQTLNLVD